MTVGSNQLHLGPRLILEDGGGIIQKLVKGHGRGWLASLASGPAGPTRWAPLLRFVLVSSGFFLSPIIIFFVAVKFCVNLAIKSSNFSFLE